MCAVVLGALCLPASVAGQEDHADDGHEHGLHFSHPIFTESVSPDTKVRFDFGREWKADGTASELEVEVEYMFHPAFSIEIVGPYVFVGPDLEPNESDFGTVDLAFKFANFAFEERGFVIGLRTRTGPAYRR